ncbi:MAG: undecaprenyldiphospho-muramoylpentapeptide beta-N-acetylglucosaminyltransferase [Lachnospiraceae bacterium]|nr:undecaprenyldiphospho-muramoylpentapeptide beta-N-acetylglucosaminyltransferase [Lachnospiraceae bacterium]MBR7014992.1 undecaprenyldiphospho-muramoylpentapeptide beta-N-acetylglucosaminyltransferase [Lachnospiraceae bacterium]
MKKIVMTGGGTAGHVTPNLALIPHLREEGFEISYIGSIDGMEKKLVEDYGIPYYGVPTGKLRRYFDLKNLTDPLRVLRGIREARKILRELDPDIIFSKGGFVAVPVVRAASMLHIPVITHESDMTPGLANRLCIPMASCVCCNFPETMNHLPADKAVLTGTPIRAELFSGSRERGFSFTGLTDEKPVILVVGGSLGAQAVNEAVRAALPELLKTWSVVHLTGKGKLDTSFEGVEGYIQYEYIKEELPDLFAMADIVISRAGANAICEIEALAKPNILIPLPAKASRGDQILNAESFEKQGFSVVLPEETVTPAVLVDAVQKLYENRDIYIKAMKESPQGDSAALIMKLINNYRLHR